MITNQLDSAPHCSENWMKYTRYTCPELEDRVKKNSKGPDRDLLSSVIIRAISHEVLLILSINFKVLIFFHTLHREEEAWCFTNCASFLHVYAHIKHVFAQYLWQDKKKRRKIYSTHSHKTPQVQYCYENQHHVWEWGISMYETELFSHGWGSVSFYTIIIVGFFYLKYLHMKKT